MPGLVQSDTTETLAGGSATDQSSAQPTLNSETFVLANRPRACTQRIPIGPTPAEMANTESAGRPRQTATAFHCGASVPQPDRPLAPEVPRQRLERSPSPPRLELVHRWWYQPSVMELRLEQRTRLGPTRWVLADQRIDASGANSALSALLGEFASRNDTASHDSSPVRPQRLTRLNHTRGTPSRPARIHDENFLGAFCLSRCEEIHHADAAGSSCR